MGTVCLPHLNKGVEARDPPGTRIDERMSTVDKYQNSLRSVYRNVGEREMSERTEKSNNNQAHWMEKPSLTTRMLNLLGVVKRSGQSSKGRKRAQQFRTGLNFVEGCRRVVGMD